MTIRQNVVCASLALVVSQLVTAPAYAADWSTVLRGSAEFGGDKLATVYYYDGYEETTRAGDGLQLAIGLGLQHSSTWYSQATLGYRIGGTSGDIGDLELTSVPVEFMTFHQTPRWRAGAGVTFVNNPRLESSGVLRGLDADFKDAAGYIGEIDWFLGSDHRFYFGIRGTFIDYETETLGSEVNGNSFGITFGTNL